MAIVKIKGARLAFPQLFEAKSFDGEGEGAYSGSFIIAKDNPAIKEIEEVMVKLATEKWGTKAAAELKTLKAQGKVALRDGDDKADYDGFPGNMYISARNKSRPLVIDRDKTPLTKADGRPYGGCIVNVNIDLWVQANNFGKRINATLVGVQFAGDGDAFSGAAPASVDDFDSVDDDGEGLV
jgi:hypothetical protein